MNSQKACVKTKSYLSFSDFEKAPFHICRGLSPYEQAGSLSPKFVTLGKALPCRVAESRLFARPAVSRPQNRYPGGVYAAEVCEN